jgi:hypothetical protein
MTMDTRRIQVIYMERDFPDQTATLYHGPLDEAPSLAAIEPPILEAIGRGETKGVIVRDGRFLADKGACRWSWWIADDGRNDA